MSLYLFKNQFLYHFLDKASLAWYLQIELSFQLFLSNSTCLASDIYGKLHVSLDWVLLGWYAGAGVREHVSLLNELPQGLQTFSIKSFEAIWSVSTALLCGGGTETVADHASEWVEWCSNKTLVLDTESKFHLTLHVMVFFAKHLKYKEHLRIYYL